MEKLQKVAVVYTRVSTTEQSNKGLSLEVQEEACTSAAARDGFVILKVIKDPGKSAGSLKGRPGIEELIRLAAAQKIHAVYMVSSDRLARNVFDHLYLRDLFRKNKVEVKYLNQPVMDDSPMSRMADTVFASFNELQRAVTSEKVKKTLTAKAEAGYFPTTAPPGYKNIPNPDPAVSRLARKVIVPDPNTAHFIQEAFKLYATGNYSVYEITDAMNERGFHTRNGVKFSPSRFYDLLRNRLYIGELHWGEAHIERAKHEPLIDRETFARVQLVLAGHNHHACRKRKHSWLLSGFVYCAAHGKRYCAEWHLNKKLAYYHCPNRFGCGKYVEMNKLEQMVAEKFKDLEFNPEFVERVIDKVKAVFYERRRDYEGRRQALVNQKTAFEAKLRTAEEKLLSGTIADEDFTRIKAQLTEEVSGIEERLFELERKHEARVDVAQEVLRLTQNIYHTYTKAEPVLKRHYLAFFWERFEVKDGVILKSVPSLLFRELLGLEQAFNRSRKTEKTIDTMGNRKLIITSPLLPG